MSPEQVRALTILLLVATSPLALVIMVALLRGYSVHITLKRDKPRDSKSDR